MSKNKYISANLLGGSDIKWVGVDMDDSIAYKIWPEEGIGEEIPGAIQSLQELQNAGWKICIFSARPWADYVAVELWFKDHNFTPDKIILGKPLFKLMIDDSAFHFTGNWQNDLPKIKEALR